MFKVKKGKESNGKFVDIISWIIVHVFMRGTVKRLDSLISKKDREELIALHKKSEEAMKRLDEVKNKIETKNKKENKRPENIVWEKNKKNKNEYRNKIISDEYEKEKYKIIDEIKSKAITESKKEGTQLEELKEKITYFINAAMYLGTKKKCSVSALCNLLKINRNNAYYILEKLEDAGMVGPDDGSRNRLVLIENKEQVELVLSITDLNELFSKEIIEEEEQ
jgi:hypothetical protein